MLADRAQLQCSQGPDGRRDDTSHIPLTRQIPPAETLARIAPYLGDHDILGCVDHTPPGLDLIHSVEVLRGNPRSGYLNLGKGFGREAALASGYMEAIEMATIEQPPAIPLFVSSDLDKRDLIYLGPERGIHPLALLGPEDAGRLLVRGSELLFGQTVYTFCDHLFLSPCAEGGRTHCSTNGLASGNTIEEAQLSAIYELIERRAFAHAVRRPESAIRARLRGVPHWLANAIEQYEDAKFRVEFFMFESVFGVQIFQCAIVEPRANKNGRDHVYFGWGAHHNAAIAVARSLCEAVQAQTIRRACQDGRITSDKLQGGMMIAAKDVLSLQSGFSPQEAALYARLRQGRLCNVRLDDRVIKLSEGVCDAFNNIKLAALLDGRTKFLSWELSGAQDLFSVVKCISVAI